MVHGHICSSPLLLLCRTIPYHTIPEAKGGLLYRLALILGFATVLRLTALAPTHLTVAPDPELGGRTRLRPFGLYRLL